MRKPLLFVTILLLITAVMSGCGHNKVYNPFIAKHYYYVQVNQPPKEGTQEYTLTGYDKTGAEKTIDFLALKVLRQGAFLKITIKSDIVTTYEEVQQEDIPQPAKDKLITPHS